MQSLNSIVEKETSVKGALMNEQLSNKEAWLLHLADTNLIFAQRNAAWCGHGPILEQDIALTNISLDLLGQARNFYQYAAALINQGTADAANTGDIKKELTEDDLAYLRTERQFKNLLLAEQPNGDWGQTILKQFLFSQFQFLLYQQLQQNQDEQLAAIAAKALKETAYHLRWSGEWVIRLGDGTDESHAKMEHALRELWPFTGELFTPASYETMDNTGFELSNLQQSWLEKVSAILEEATLQKSSFGTGKKETVFMQTGGKEGIHTEQLGYILAEMQYLQRTYPNLNW